MREEGSIASTHTKQLSSCRVSSWNIPTQAPYPVLCSTSTAGAFLGALHLAVGPDSCPFEFAEELWEGFRGDYLHFNQFISILPAKWILSQYRCAWLHTGGAWSGREALRVARRPRGSMLCRVLSSWVGASFQQKKRNQSSWNLLEKVRRWRDGYEYAAVRWAVVCARRGLRLLAEEEFNQEWLICADIFPPNTLRLTQHVSVDKISRWMLCSQMCQTTGETDAPNPLPAEQCLLCNILSMNVPPRLNVEVQNLGVTVRWQELCPYLSLHGYLRAWLHRCMSG